MTDDMFDAAIELAVNNWAVLPLRGKIPAIAGGRGVLDATIDVDQVTAWWSGPYRGCNIGARVPESMFVLDVDNLDALAALEREKGALPDTLTTISGRAAGGKHFYFRRPAGKLSHRRLPAGVEIKTSAGYTVQPPSVHPDTGNVYTRIGGGVAAPADWLVDLLLPEPPKPSARHRPIYCVHTGLSVADQFTVQATWQTILEVHGWQCIDADPEADGARWRHPSATSKWSATIKHGLLFVYSPNTPFDMTVPGDPHGYTKFRAYGVLDHRGDLSAAARALRGQAVAR
jgi:Bifunctional DNA primase/polymerase, N-terminal